MEKMDEHHRLERLKKENIRLRKTNYKLIDKLAEKDKEIKKVKLEGRHWMEVLKNKRGKYKNGEGK